MQINERKLDDITVLELGGHLVQDENKQFKNCFTAAIHAGSRKLIINLAHVEYMDSNGLGELISCYTSLRALRGTMTLLHVNPRLQNLLAITKLNTVFETYETEAAAVASFTRHSESEVSSNEDIACLP